MAVAFRVFVVLSMPFQLDEENMCPFGAPKNTIIKWTMFMILFIFVLGYSDKMLKVPTIK